MAMIRDLKPAVLIGAGNIIKRELEYNGWSQEDLAQITELSGKTISQLINNKQRVTVETAKLLSNALGSSPEFWLNLDNNYRLQLDDETDKESAVKTKAEIRKYMPVAEICRKGWYCSDNTAEGYKAVYKDIWKQNNVDFSVYNKPDVEYCARRSKEDEQFTQFYSQTWIQIAKNHAEKIDVPDYNPALLKKISETLSGYTIQPNGVRRIINDLNSAGVKVFVQSHLSKTYLDGACFFDGKNPVIVYTARYDRVDNFWFTLAHEAAHVLLHLSPEGENCILDDLESDNTSKIEKEADSAAEKMLKIKEILRLATPYRKYLSEVNLRNISRQLNIEISVILGILQHYKFVDYRKLNKFKTKVMPLFPAEVMMG